MESREFLKKFITAQAEHYETALAEIRAGKKRSHWMWYIFPQLRGLGQSPMAHYYGLTGLDQAKAYLEDPILRKNLVEITGALLRLEQSDPVAIFGSIDSLKLRSCLTLFAQAAPDIPEFSQALEKFYQNRRDPQTLTLLTRGK